MRSVADRESAPVSRGSALCPGPCYPARICPRIDENGCAVTRLNHAQERVIGRTTRYHQYKRMKGYDDSDAIAYMM